MRPEDLYGDRLTQAGRPINEQGCNEVPGTLKQVQYLNEEIDKLRAVIKERDEELLMAYRRLFRGGY